MDDILGEWLVFHESLQYSSSRAREVSSPNLAKAHQRQQTSSNCSHCQRLKVSVWILVDMTLTLQAQEYETTPIKLKRI